MQIRALLIPSTILPLAISVVVGWSLAWCDSAATKAKLRYRSGKGQLTLRLMVDSDSAGCRIDVYAASSKRKLQRNRSATTVIYAALLSGTSQSISTQDAAVLRSRRNGKTQLFLQPTLTCGGSQLAGGISRATLKGVRGKEALALKQWVSTIRGSFLAAGAEIKRAFPALSFQQPVDLQSPSDGSQRIFIVEQRGVIKAFQNTASVSSAATFLDLSAKVRFDGEQGLLGMAFHPRYSENGYFYLNYTRKADGATVIARYSVSVSDPESADSGSEAIILIQEQPFTNHNGGALAFGPDGYLYIALGDGGSGGDPLGHGQNTASLLGSILRIDVDLPRGAINYSIPSDNPFAEDPARGAGEIYAYGLRNPWRISFDPATALLWCGDVGQGEREEVDIISAGGNYGWNITEGDKCYNSSSCNSSGLVAPITDYTHEVGQSITGGYVYRGSLYPAMQGFYFYADFISGVMFALEAGNRYPVGSEVLTSDLNISSFGIDSSGELYLLSYSDGAVYQVIQR